MVNNHGCIELTKFTFEFTLAWLSCLCKVQKIGRYAGMGIRQLIVLRRTYMAPYLTQPIARYFLNRFPYHTTHHRLLDWRFYSVCWLKNIGWFWSCINLLITTFVLWISICILFHTQYEPFRGARFWGASIYVYGETSPINKRDGNKWVWRSVRCKHTYTEKNRR